MPTLEALQVARQQIQVAIDGVASAKNALNEAASQYLMESPESELLDRAAYIYWKFLDVPGWVIASAVIGDNSISKLLPLLPTQVLNIKCSRCGGDIEVTSREALKTAQRWGSQLTCPACLERETHQRCYEMESESKSEAERLQALSTMPYQEYLLTKEWLETRNRKLKQAHFKCQLCGSGGLLNVHHRTYERRGHENMADLIVLCHTCHAKFHDKLP